MLTSNLKLRLIIRHSACDRTLNLTSTKSGLRADLPPCIAEITRIEFWVELYCCKYRILLSRHPIKMAKYIRKCISQLFKMHYIRLTAVLMALLATCSAQNVVGDCADVYDTGSGYCNVRFQVMSSKFTLYFCSEFAFHYFIPLLTK